MRRGICHIVFALLVILACVVGALVYLVRVPLPSEDGSFEVTGLGGEVQIEFDRLGIPHIIAGRDTDAFHALGFVTARDRLFQMDLLRRGTAGRLAEILGADLLEEDRWNRTMGFDHVAGAILARLPVTQRQLIEAYTAGINQAMAATSMFPVEFTMLGYRPEPWKPEDCILVMLAMQSMLTWTGDQERTATVMRHVLPRSVVDFLTPESDCYNEITAPRNPGRCATDAIPVADLIAVLNNANTGGDNNSGIVSGNGSPRGSNAWVVGGSKTQDGRAILSNDMHLELSVPNPSYSPN